MTSSYDLSVVSLMEGYSKANVVGIFRVSMNNEEVYAVVLSCKEWGNMLLPIFIGSSEAFSIHLALEGYKPRRPLTHDLMVNILETLGITVEKVTIDAVVDNLFTATIILKNESGKRWYIDARPSDSIALALRVKAPIFVANRLKNYAIPEEEFTY